MDGIALFRIIFWRNKLHFGKITNFPVIKITIKRIAFENAHESSIIFQPLLYANVPAESPSYAPTFFNNVWKVIVAGPWASVFVSLPGQIPNTDPCALNKCIHNWLFVFQLYCIDYHVVSYVLTKSWFHTSRYRYLLAPSLSALKSKQIVCSFNSRYSVSY